MAIFECKKIKDGQKENYQEIDMDKFERMKEAGTLKEGVLYLIKKEEPSITIHDHVSSEHRVDKLDSIHTMMAIQTSLLMMILGISIIAVVSFFMLK